MPITLKYINDGVGVEFVLSGRVTGAEIIEANKEIYRTIEKILKQKYQLIDRTQCTEYHITAEHIKIIAAQDKEAAKLNPNIMMVFVATNAQQFGASRMWQEHVGESGFLTKIFRNRKSADKWLEQQLKKNANRA
jgi:hypothetical protein